MDIRKKLLRSALYREATPWLLMITLLAVLIALAAFSAREPGAVYADANENSSVYYSSNPEASQGSTSSDAINSRIIKNYTIRIYEDSIAIFEENALLPLYTIDTPPSRLPAADRLLLEQGIRTDSLAAAYKLIEDYE